MSKSLSQLIDEARSALDEPTARFWSDTELTRWINDGLVDIARKAQTIQQYSANITGVLGQAKYALPDDLITLHRVEFLDAGGTQVIPLDLLTVEQLDQYWGTQQDTQSSYPFVAYLWGTPGIGTGLQIGIYPTLSSNGGTIRIWYYRLPTTLASSIDVAEIPSGWESLVSDYCEYRAKRKAKDPTWQEAKSLFDEALDDMIDATRSWHDSNNVIQYGGNALPSWLTSLGDY